MISYNPTPVKQLQADLFEKTGVTVLVKREDLNHPFVSGNKWWKLKHNLRLVLEEKYQTILTFGGAFSNHLFSTAAACHEMGIKSVGIVRGEKVTPLNPTLSFCEAHGMELRFISRADYRNKDDAALINKFTAEFGRFYLIPEGGSNNLGYKGCIEFCREICDLDFSHVVLAVGTGCTMAGLVAGLPDREVIGVSVLKNGNFILDEITQYAGNQSAIARHRLLTDYHFGGYAKWTAELLEFIKHSRELYDLPLDHVYTGKAFFALMNEIKEGRFERGSRILFIHTGGLQGNFRLE